MKIELVGGPECGTVRESAYIDPVLVFGGVTYVRRDRPLNLSEKHGACYGQTGARMYDAKRKGEWNAE